MALERRPWDNNGPKENPLRRKIRVAWRKDHKCSMCVDCGFAKRSEVWDNCDPLWCAGPEHVGTCSRCKTLRVVNGCQYCKNCWEMLPPMNKQTIFAKRNAIRKDNNLPTCELGREFYLQNEHYLSEEELYGPTPQGLKKTQSNDKN